MSSKVTVHPDALKAAENSYYNYGGGSYGGRANAYDALIQWYIDHPQITDEQVSQLRGECSYNPDGNRKFRDKFLILALSGEPEVPQELRDKFPNWDTMNHDRQNELLVAYNLGKGAK